MMNEINNICCITEWYQQFKHVTIKSYFISLNQEFVQYLLSDGIILPEGCELPVHCSTSCSSSDNEEEWPDNDSIKRPCFTELIYELCKNIELLNGAVFPKINTSSPKDAAWINYNNTLKCTLPAEIILLLKSSDIIASTLSNERNSNVQLCLREWIDIHPSGEYRCFIKNSHIIGISQRQISICYKHLLNSTQDILSDINDFYDKYILDKFPLQNFVMDVYRPVKGSIILIDFGLFNNVKTDSLLFTWSELNQEQQHDIELRLVDPQSAIIYQPITNNLPQDTVDLCAGNDVHKLVDLLKMQKEETS